MELSQDFIRFLKEYKIVGLAIAVVIGTAAKDLVNLPGESWREATVTLGGVEFGTRTRFARAAIE
ncbi:MAG: hypothetical protein SVS85_03940 [Candidatus Nanohaloarchaea archaeon]|nr:hypothetical protein [Candidatus Nanohaloarchaea archaeon]